MTLNLLSVVYYKIISSLSKLVSDKYWLGKHIAQSLPLTHFKRLKIDKCSLFYGKDYIGRTSIDNQVSIIKDQKMLKAMKKNNGDIFENDFLALSQMTYFIFCYLFKPSDYESNFNDRWRCFHKALLHDKVSSFGRTIKVTVDLLTNLNNNNVPPEFANTLENCHTTPPILTEFGVVFDVNGLEFNLLHYTVKIPHSGEHVSLVLLENNNQRFYKLSKIHGDITSDLMHKVDYLEYFKFDIKEFSRYNTAVDFIGDFSMLLVKGIYPAYKEDSHPRQYDKIIFDMVHY